MDRQVIKNGIPWSMSCALENEEETWWVFIAMDVSLAVKASR